MKQLLAILLLMPVLALAQKQPPFVTYEFPLTHVIDGDTVEFQATFLPAPLKPVLSVRIYGVDTPEKGFRAQCLSEAEHGAAATEYTKKVVNASKKRLITIISWDKYGGRVLGDVILDGQSLRALLIQNGYAREYYGEAKRSWCN